MDRALPAVVRVLGRLPRGRLVRRRETCVHSREAQESPRVALAARLVGDPLHLPGPGPDRGGPAPAHQQRDRGRGQRAAPGHAQEPPRHVAHAAREGCLLVVPPAHRGPRPPRETLASMATDDDIDLLYRTYAIGSKCEDGGPKRGDRAVWEELHHRDPYPSGWTRTRVLSRHTFCPISPSID